MLIEEHRAILLSAAEQSIRQGVMGRKPAEVEVSSFPEPLQAVLASFVTLEKGGGLRGCIGMLTASHPLIQDVVNNAYSAGFRDPRFPPLSANEVDELDLHISVLSTPEPMTFSDEADLVSQLRPGVDGLILSDAGHRGTFLPSVWDQLPEPTEFLQHLKRKAGLPFNHWSANLRMERYETESFGRPISD